METPHLDAIHRSKARLTDGKLLEGVALDIVSARMRIGKYHGLRNLKPNAEYAKFTARLEAGPTRLYTWFGDSRSQPIVGAYYVYVNRVGD